MPTKKKFKRVLLKLSGESLAESGSGIDAQTTESLAAELAKVNKKGVALAIVVGGGNIWRFRDNTDAKFLEREQSDKLGMLATVFNGTALAAALQAKKINAVAFSAIDNPVLPRYEICSAKNVLESGGIAIVTGGTSNPYFTTDSAAALRAVELGCDRVLKATNVDGVYDSDPRKNKNAKLLKKLSFAEVIEKNLGVMDATAFALMAEHSMPLTVFNFEKKELLAPAAAGQNVGTQIS